MCTVDRCRPWAQERGKENKTNKNNSLSIFNSQSMSKTTKRNDSGHKQRQVRYSFYLYDSASLFINDNSQKWNKAIASITTMLSQIRGSKGGEAECQEILRGT